MAFSAIAAAPATAQPFFDAPWRAFDTGSWDNGRFSVAMAAGDLNNDGRPDAVTGQNVFIPGVRVFLNQGSAPGEPATFGDGVLYSTPRGAWGVVIADFDGDLDRDVAATDTDANYVGSQIVLFRNNGAGTLSGPQSFPSGGPSTGLVAMNLDGDTDVDLAVANYGFIGSGTTISVLLNNGTGTFAAPVPYTVGSGPNDIQAGDLDGDGDADLAVAHDGGSRVSLLFNNGNGTFAPAVPFDNLFEGNGPPELALLDIDGDQDLDVVRSGYFDHTANDARLVLLRNAGSRVFQLELLPYGLPFRNPAFDLAVADLDGDQRDDLIGAHFFEPGIIVFEDDNAGRFMPGNMIAGVPNTVGVAAPDLDGDTDSDALAVSRIQRILTAHENTGGGVFPELPIQGRGSLHQVIDLGDIDGDGDLDAVTSHGGASFSDVVVYRNSGNGTFVESYRTPTPNDIPAAYAKLRRLDADNVLDLLFVTAPGPPFATSSDFWTARGLGNGSFGPIVRHTLNACGLAHPNAIDLDADGDLDVICTENSACVNIPESGRRLFISKNNGNGTFQPPFVVLAGAAPYNVTSGDFNEDGKVDLATASQSISALLFGNGDGTFQAAQPLPIGRLGDNILTLDLNSDGNQDLVSLEDDPHSESVLSVLLGNGAGQFALTEYIARPTQDFREWVASGDVDVDGDVDLLVSGVQDALVFLNNGAGAFTFSGRYGIGTDGFGMHLADVTGDGQGDLVALVAHETPPAGFDHGLVVVPGIRRTTGVEPEAGPAASPVVSTVSVQPNPFNKSTKVQLLLEQTQRVTLDLHDVQGRRVLKLHEGNLAAGVQHSFAINSSGLPNGVYYLRLVGESFTRSTPIVILR